MAPKASAIQSLRAAVSATASPAHGHTSDRPKVPNFHAIPLVFKPSDVRALQGFWFG